MNKLEIPTLFAHSKREIQTFQFSEEKEAQEIATIAHFFYGNFIPCKVLLIGKKSPRKEDIWQRIQEKMHGDFLLRRDIATLKTKIYMRPFEHSWFILNLAYPAQAKMIEGFTGPLEGRNLLWLALEPLSKEVKEVISSCLYQDDNFVFLFSEAYHAPRNH